MDAFYIYFSIHASNNLFSSFMRSLLSLSGAAVTLEEVYKAVKYLEVLNEVAEKEVVLATDLFFKRLFSIFSTINQ
jgi:hypothetical protein